MRVCFQLQVKPDRLADYQERHAHVWPDMLAALHESGWHNLGFVRDDGLLIGYFETPSLEAALAGMARTGERSWQTEMAEYFEELDGLAPDEGFLVLEEVFHLEDQLTTHTQKTE